MPTAKFNKFGLGGGRNLPGSPVAGLSPGAGVVAPVGYSFLLYKDAGGAYPQILYKDALGVYQPLAFKAA